jgi:Na+-translocating ferredoxin:NAD+ oxidoreductase RnfD subunit
MSAVALAPSLPFRSLRRFFQTPKGYLVIILALIAAIAAPSQGLAFALTDLIGASVAALVVDMAIVWVRRREVAFQSGGLLTGMLVALVLSAQQPWYVPVATAVIAIVAKHLFRSGTANIFNPAAFAIVCAYFLFGSGDSWWGSFPDLSPLALIVVIATGIFIANHLNKLPLILTFIAGYLVVFTLSTYVFDPSQVAEIFRSPDINMMLFFAFFMLDDPPTSPVRYPDQIRFGLIVAVASFAIFVASGAVWYLLAGLLLGNVWEAWRRAAARAARAGAV